jgi:ubiquinone/menaquinone biosynthesis C-methylase UbiE
MPRVNYDQGANVYDAHCAKRVDTDLLAFLDARPGLALDDVRILDVGCGTGAQLVADQPEIPAARFVGLDPFRGMLARAASKSADISWVQGDGARLPFAAGSFDYLTSQISFDHVQDKPSMIAEVVRVLRPDGRFVMTNVCPRENRDELHYQYFPAALELDLRDFMPRGEIAPRMRAVGFESVEDTLNTHEFEITLEKFAAQMRERTSSSQLIAMADTDFNRGMRRIEGELARADGEPVVKTWRVCMLTLRGDKPH